MPKWRLQHSIQLALKSVSIILSNQSFQLSHLSSVSFLHRRYNRKIIELNNNTNKLNRLTTVAVIYTINGILLTSLLRVQKIARMFVNLKNTGIFGLFYNMWYWQRLFTRLQNVIFIRYYTKATVTYKH